MIDATYLKAHRTATSMGEKKGGRGRLIGRIKGGLFEHETAHHLRQPGSAAQPVYHRRIDKRLHRRMCAVQQLAKGRLAARRLWL